MIEHCDKCGDEIREECGCCGGYHNAAFYGDCRNDAERFPAACSCDMSPSEEVDGKKMAEMLCAIGGDLAGD